MTTIALSGLVSAGVAAGTWLNGSDPHRAVTDLPGAAGWPAAVRAGAPGVAAPDLDALTPARARRFFAGLSPAARTALARRAPGVVGNLDGAPLRLRYAANERTARADGAVTASPGPSRGRLLAYDPRGDGKIAEVFGDLATARQIVVIIPGCGWTLSKILASGRPDPATAAVNAAGKVADKVAGNAPGKVAGDVAGAANPIAGARALLAEIRGREPAAQVAVVVWLGYDAPESIDQQAARSERAVTGARALTRFLAGLPGDGPVTLASHSYGSIVAGRAARHNPRVTDVVALASPGMDTGSVSGLRTRARVWAARAPGDPIAFAPNVRIWRYGHGVDPVDPGFGALVFRTGSARGHGGYYLPGTESLRNLARIALGRTREVTLVAHAR
ncbi:MAG TPA: alpha/beta hydrolase [Streptosporangiaceae bacterium]|nr:alpha/beta hydrolase [Streptosporangiaceae bacterium]